MNFNDIKNRFQMHNRERVMNDPYNKKIYFTTVKIDYGQLGSEKYLIFYDNIRFLNDFVPTAYQLDKAKSYKKGYIGFITDKRNDYNEKIKSFSVFSLNRAHPAPKEMNKATIEELVDKGYGLKIM